MGEREAERQKVERAGRPLKQTQRGFGCETDEEVLNTYLQQAAEMDPNS